MDPVAITVQLGPAEFSCQCAAIRPSSSENPIKKESTVPDLGFVLLTAALFVLLGLVVRGVERL